MNYTDKQRRALHLWCRKFAKALNDAGMLRKRAKIGAEFVDLDNFMKLITDVLIKYPNENDLNNVKSITDDLKDLGIKIIKGGVIEQDWSMETFKEEVYKPMLKALSGKDSTEDQTSIDPEEVSKHINRYMGQNFGVTVGWPHQGELHERI